MRRMRPTSATAGRRYGSSQMPDTLIREAHRRVRRRISVLDDDPTGSQTVHDATIVTRFAPKGSSAGLAEPGDALTEGRAYKHHARPTLTDLSGALLA